jgi:hypothetical protein
MICLFYSIIHHLPILKTKYLHISEQKDSIEYEKLPGWRWVSIFILIGIGVCL